MGVCLLGNQCRLKSSSSILRNSQVVLQGTEQVARSQSEKPLTSSEGSVTRRSRRITSRRNSSSSKGPSTGSAAMTLNAPAPPWWRGSNRHYSKIKIASKRSGSRTGADSGNEQTDYLWFAHFPSVF